MIFYGKTSLAELLTFRRQDDFSTIFILILFLLYFLFLSFTSEAAA